MSTTPLNDPARQYSQLPDGDRDDTGGPPRCENCHTVVSAAYVRVFSDDPDNQRLQHCYACKSRTERY